MVTTFTNLDFLGLPKTDASGLPLAYFLLFLLVEVALQQSIHNTSAGWITAITGKVFGILSDEPNVDK